MSFNLFAAPTKDDIKVGYIDPTLGFVNGVSVCEANEYAKNNPGTTFVFRDGDNNIRYLSINEVNLLTPNDLIASEGECAGIQEYRECGPPIIQFFGGGGIGAAGNPIIGRDGSLLAVDLITGGYGYQYPPIVAAKDYCQIGNGAVLTAVLGETSDEIEVFEGEEDFEEYQLCKDTDVGYGKRFGPNGEELGPWEPQVYTRVGADPIQREIEIFQRALKNPFWTTRETQPDRVYTIEKSYATQDTVPVTFSQWGEFMNTYAVSPIKPSDLIGSSEAGKIFSMEWELNFPVSGEYIFRGVCDDTAQVFVDGSLVGNLKGFKDNPSPLQKTISEGNHILKVDLLNAPAIEKPTATDTSTSTTTPSNIKAKFIKEGSNFYLQVDGTGSGEINFVMDVDDNPNFAGLAAREVIIPSDGGKVIFKRKGKTGSGVFAGNAIFDVTVPEKETIKENGKFSGGRKYGPIQIVGSGVGARGPIIKSPNRLGIRDADGDDENIKITIGNIKGDTISNTPTSTATSKKVEVNFKISEAGSDESSIEIVDLLTASKDEEITKKLEVGKVYQVIASPSNRKLRADGKVLRLEDSTDNDFNDLVIRVTKGKFYNVNGNRCKFVLESPIEVGEVISSKSWNDDPMGVSMIIESPLPPVPQEKLPVQIGRCPPNPIWTTRFPGSSQKWYPVRFSGSKTIVQETISTSTPEPVSETQEVRFAVFGEGRQSKYLSFTFTAVDGQHTFKLDGAEKSGETRVDKINIRKNVNYVISVKQSTNKKVEQGLIKEGTKRKEGGIGESNRIFADAIGSTNDNDDIQVKANIGKFISSNRGKTGDRTTFDLTYVLDAKDSPGGTKNTTETSTKVFENSGWSRFMNRYAISPTLPLDTPGSDKSGTTFSNSWQVDLPYPGFYGVKGTGDNTGRILIDGKEVYSLDGFNVDNPKLSKVYLKKGRHTIVTEIFNNPVENQNVIDTKIFSTQDWRSPAVSPSSPPFNIKAKFIKEGSNFYLQVDGTGSGEINFVMDVDDRSFVAGLAAKEVIIPSDGGKVIFKRKGKTGSGAFANSAIFDITVPQKETIKENGKFSAGKKYGPIQIIGAGVGARGPIIKSPNRLGIRDADGDDENIKITIGNIKQTVSSTPSTNISQSPAKNGVTYTGPNLFGHVDKRWSKYMNTYSVSPQVSENIGKFTLTWSNVDFPYDGTYKFNLQSDNNALLKVGGREILRTSDFTGEKIQYTFNATQGKYDVVLELENVKTEKGGKDESVFASNPMGVALSISKDVSFDETNKTPWTTNPMGVSAILIPPPCAKKIGGRGVIDRVEVIDTGNGYLPPGEQGPGYPVTLVLDEIKVIDTGINYRCGEDEIKIFPDNGAKFSYTCDSFGRIKDVKVDIPGDPITVNPIITIGPPPGPPPGPSGPPSNFAIPAVPGAPSAPFQEPTGVNASFRPVFRVVRDPILPPEQRDKIIQVTDLVGLKQTGYIDGRAYYGAIYYDEGVPYAGYYKTVGPQTRVYTTLQESISARVTTPASAIQRSGTDITSNDPRLNIPGTIQDTE
jgi:hypothetical protein